MLFIVIGLVVVCCGAVLCGYGIAVSRNRTKQSGNDVTNRDLERYQQFISDAEQRADKAVTDGKAAYENIQTIIHDIRRSSSGSSVSVSVEQ